jgi:hypothetical protein
MPFPGSCICIYILQEGSVFRGTFDFLDEEYDWGNDYKRPDIAPGNLVIYEMVIRSFTADESSGVGPALEGTFKGVEAKVRDASCGSFLCIHLPLNLGTASVCAYARASIFICMLIFSSRT